MKWLFKLVAAILINAVALWLANHYIPGFILTGGFLGLLILAVILFILNALLKPILKLILGPFIIITLGLALLVVNGVVLEVLYILSKNLMIGGIPVHLVIQGIPALIYATLLVSAVNLVAHLIF